MANSPRDSPKDERTPDRVVSAGDGELVLEGTVLRGRSFEPIEGRVVAEDGRIVAVEEDRVDSDAVVLPAFVNAHTHIGDSVAKEAGEGLSLDELVAPPDGLKHRILRATDQATLVTAMRRTLRQMAATGTTAHIEFREGGLDGVRDFRLASADSVVDTVLLGRESKAAMEAADGFGASGARDADFDALRNATREAGKLFGIHAGERDGHDVNAALDLDPDFLVHMVHAEGIHLDRVADGDVPVVVCPRSNLVTNVGVPSIRDLNERTTVGLGTDNVMTNSPDMFREMEFAAKLSDLPSEDILRMATVNGAEIGGLNCGLVEEGRSADLLVLDGDSDNLAGAEDVVRAVVRRAGPTDIERVVLS